MRRTLLLILLGMSVSAWADSWIAPMKAEYCHANGVHCFVVTPATKDKTKAHGTLMQQQKGQRREVWSINLPNPGAPMKAAVSADGKYVAMFDEWGRLGYGKDVVVLYGPRGQLIQRFALEDLRSKEQLETIPMTTSSRWWGGEHFFDEANQQLVLRIVTNSKMPTDKNAAFRELRIDLRTGKEVPNVK